MLIPLIEPLSLLFNNTIPLIFITLPPSLNFMNLLQSSSSPTIIVLFCFDFKSRSLEFINLGIILTDIKKMRQTKNYI